MKRFIAAALIAVAAIAPGLLPRAADVAVAPTSVTITGVDAHDGTVYKDGDTYYLVGTRYSCPAGTFQWGIVPTTFCGYAAYSAPALAGPWTYVRQLFPTTELSPYNGTSWQHTCGDEGSGCFNPRMVQRPDGVWVLWWNGPFDEVHTGANGYYSRTCSGPAGPCTGTAHKPSVWKCNNSGDFSIVSEGATAWIVCNTNGYSLAVEQLNSTWTDGINVGFRGNSITGIEAPGAFKAADGTWVVTFSDPACGYCAGTATGYAVASTPTGPWTWPTNATSSGGDPNARRKISADSCGGQPRTVVTIDGQVYQYIDLWLGTRNETSAGIHLAPLETNPPYTQAPNGQLWTGGVKHLTCT